MTAVAEADPRNVVPSWRPTDRASSAGEIQSAVRVSREVDLRQLEEPAQAFVTQPGLHTALDLLATAEMLSIHNELTTAAGSLVSSRRSIEYQGIRGKPLGSDESVVDASRVALRRLRARLSSDPRDALSWVDASLAYTNLGQRRPAVKAMETALRLSSEHRLVVRSASRLFIHLGDDDRGFEVLDRTEARRYDPWVAASYLAAAEVAGVRASDTRLALEMLVDTNLSPSSTAELASQLGTIELRSGRDRRGKALVQQSLRAPNGNVLAQATSMSSLGAAAPTDALVDSTPLADEARARLSAHELDFDASLVAAQHWQADQSFSSDAATFASWAAAVFDRGYEDAAEMVEQSLITNPNEPMLLNNGAFVDIQLSRFGAATQKLKKANAGNGVVQDASLIATTGLLAFRLGEPQRGRELYERSAKMLDHEPNKYSFELACLFWALEERRVARSAVLVPLLESAVKRNLASPIPELRLLASRVHATESA